MTRIEELELENARLQEELKRLYGIERPFICGTLGVLDDDGLPTNILVCPSYGASGFAIYRKHKDYDEPSY